MKSNKRIRYGYILQIVVIIGIQIISLLTQPSRFVTAIVLIIILGAYLTDEYFCLSGTIRKVNVIVQILFQPFAFSYTAGTLLTLITPFKIMPVVSLCILVWYTISFFPYIQQFIAPIKNNGLRLFWLIYFFQIAISPLAYFGITSSTNPWFGAFFSTGLIGAVAYSIGLIKTMQAWHFGDPIILIKNRSKDNVLVISVFAILVALFIYSNLVNINTWAKLSSLRFWQLLLEAMEAGIGEEVLCRFGILTLLLYFVRKLSLRIPIAIIGSSLLFGLFHFLNLTGQGLALTIYQFCFTAVSGIFFSLLFLYSGHLELVIVIHFMMDLLSYSATGDSSLSGNITLSEYQSVINLTFLMLVLLIWMMFGKRHQVMEKHAKLLISRGNDK
ncbi:MAG: CPBP family intramembrane glutamic endopeptidase [Limosilactobacillus pontis]|uniref:CPBP family intramembrane metalloprotease domain-containing protein n=1 Tax=Limosilactobacillus pontis TaxID=35787 RepID=A0A2J6NN37_9LACO|nr:CPBP family intramembrane glutamic endopeptidase [Limosilactobacillus pontis]PMB82740.1 CPBP family intramembrane metalloprotease domain-containing protein [Limosilactobacillus pontis]